MIVIVELSGQKSSDFSVYVDANATQMIAPASAPTVAGSSRLLKNTNAMTAMSAAPKI